MLNLTGGHTESRTTTRLPGRPKSPTSPNNIHSSFTPKPLGREPKMCGCKRRRSARAAWREQRAAPGGGGCGRGGRFGPGANTPSRPPFIRGPFGRWRDQPRNGPGNPSQPQSFSPRDAPPPLDIDKAATLPPPRQQEAGRASLMSSPFSRFRDSIRSDSKTNNQRESTTALPPRYTAGVAEEAPRMDTNRQAGKSESLPPAYDVANKY